MSRDSADRQLGFLASRAGVSDSSMVSEELRLVQTQGMENGSSSRVMFPGDAIPFPFDGNCVDHSAGEKPRPAFGFVMGGNKLFPSDMGVGRLFPSQQAALRCSLYVSQRRMEPDGGNVRIRDWNAEGNGDSVSGGVGSDGDTDDDDEEDGVDDDEYDGDGEVDALVTVDVGNDNKNSNNNNGNVQNCSEMIRSDKPNVDEHHSCLGLSRTVTAKHGNEIVENSDEQHHRLTNCEKAIIVVEPEPYCAGIFHGGDGAATPQKDVGGDNVHGFRDPLRTHLSDPVTGMLMDDAIVLPCGHSFGDGGMQHVHIMKACIKCSIPISEGSVRPNLALRAAVEAFRREEESHSSRTSKRRRGRFDWDKYSYNDQLPMDSRSRGVQFPFSVSDRVIIKGNKRTPERFVGRVAVVTTQCLNGWYVVKTLDNAESIKLQYRSLAKLPDDSSKFIGNKSIPSNWL